jgi:hypothetical protein
MAELPTRIRTKAEQAYATHFAALSDADPMHEIRAAAFDAFIEKGPAASPRRGMEVHRFARAAARRAGSRRACHSG